MKKLLVFLLLGLFMISFVSADLIDDVVSYYKLDDNLATTNILDSINVNNGTLIGGDNTDDKSVAGKINLSQQLNGVDDSIDLLDNIGTDIFTASLWIKRVGVPDATEIVINRWDTTEDGTENRFAIRFTGIDLQAYAGDDATWTAVQDDIDTNFHHLVISYTGTVAKIYVDGVSKLNITTTYSESTGAGDQWTLGRFSTSGDEWAGIVDEAGFWNRSLTNEEISDLYNSGDGITYPFPLDSVDVTLNTPVNNTIVSSNVTFNATMKPPTSFNFTNATLFIWDSSGDLFFSQTNLVTGNETNSTNFIVSNLTSDNYEWNVLGTSENSTGFVISNFSTFNNTFTWIPFEVDNEEFNNFVFETSRQEFLLNITTLPSVLSVDAILNYNGTRFTASTSCSVGLCEISTAIDIPLISTGESENKSFFWEISIFDGTTSFSTNITSNEQNVTRLHLEVCDGTFTVQTLNFTAFDEQTQNFIDPFSFDASLQFWLGTGTVKRNNSISNSSAPSIQLCITPSVETFFLDGTVEYDENSSSTNYTNKNYFFQTDQISNVSQDIKLGLLLSEDSTSFILKVQNRDILPVPNVLIYTQRFYPGEGIFRTVQVSETDDNGATIGFFQTETVEYRFILKQNGTTVLTTNKQKIVGESVPFTLTFTIGEDEGAAWEPFEEIEDLESEIGFNKTSNIVSFTYLDTSGNFSLGRLIVEKVNASGLQNTVICSETSIQSSATITCNVTGNSTGQYIVRGIITRNGVAQLVEQGSFAIEDFSTIAGRLGLFLGWFIILISVFTFKFNEVAGIILVNLAIIFVNLIGLISFGYVFISAMVAISIIILVVLER